MLNTKDACLKNEISVMAAYERKVKNGMNGTKDTILGQTVTVVMDRPMGTYHPKHKDMYYPVNYGYVPGILAADGEEQDAYVLGVDMPLAEFTGIVLAIIHRFDDVEEKWVVVPEGVRLSKEKIAEQVKFQEQYFRTEIRMKEGL